MASCDTAYRNSSAWPQLQPYQNTALQKLCTEDYQNTSDAQRLYQPMPTYITPGNVRLEGGDSGLQLLVSADEGVLVDFPDVLEVVPGGQVALKALGSGLHATKDHVVPLACVLTPAQLPEKMLRSTFV